MKISIVTEDAENPENVRHSNVRLKFLHQILQWKPQWFLNKNATSIFTSLKLTQPKLSYENFEEYCQVQLPLLVYEFWNDLVEFHSTLDDNDEVKPQSLELFKIPLFNRCLKVNPDDDTNDRIYRFKARAKISSDTNVWFPRHSTLIKFKNPSAENQEQYAYIDYLTRQKVEDKPEYELLYELVTKYMRKNNIPDSIVVEPVKMKISLTLNYLNSLVLLEKSPLCVAILKPTFNDHEFSPINDKDQIKPVTKDKLDSKQLEAMARIVKTVEDKKSKICLVSGPAGTGKSKLIINSVLSMLSRKSTDRILVCGQSNLTIDSIVLQLLDEKSAMKEKGIECKVLRLGPEEKMNELVKPVSFISLTKSVDANKKSEYIQKLMLNSNVIVSTLMSCRAAYYRNHLQDLNISVCIIDEASQASELETFLPLKLGVRMLFLVGDPHQFKPRVHSEEVMKVLNLDKSFFHRVHKIFEKKDKTPILSLNTQYRMTKAISQWPNHYFYKGVLKNEATVQPLGIYKYKLLNHSSPEEEDGLTNIGEAKLIVDITYALLMLMGLGKFDFKVSLGIITLFEEQRDLIIKMFDQEERFKSISKERRDRMNIKVVKMSDCFQGSQCDIIILSCVQSKPTDHIYDPHRICVSLTRAKHTLIICGNLTKYKENAMWKDLLDDAEDRDALLDIEVDQLDKPKNIKWLLIPCKQII
ncbi:GSCOCG00004829001-RA-CDS [Cotesia congregata]|nr:GSCOCG00004829001-RA-CDS [Cotesia congregata]